MSYGHFYSDLKVILFIINIKIFFFIINDEKFSQARCLITLLQEWGWTLYSLIYSDGGAEGDIAKHLLRGSGSTKIRPAVMEPIPLQVCTPVY